MNTQKVRNYTIGIMLILLAVAACGVPAATSTPIPPTAAPTARPPTATATPIPASATRTPWIVESCLDMDVAYPVVAESWIDENADGTWNKGESALPGVKMTLGLVWENDGMVFGGVGLSDMRGEAVVYARYHTWHFFDSPQIVIYPETPEGYYLTTADQLQPTDKAEILQFGFALGAPTTPAPRLRQVGPPKEPPGWHSCGHTISEWAVLAESWFDENADGIWDMGEPALPGVQITLSSTWEDGRVVIEDTGLTDLGGRVVLDVSYILHEAFVSPMTVVYPDTPPGLRLTTAERLDLGAALGPRLQFGFAPEGSTATPQP